MFAKDIMTKDVITVSPTATVRNLAMTLIKNQISGAPVAGSVSSRTSPDAGSTISPSMKSPNRRP